MKIKYCLIALVALAACTREMDRSQGKGFLSVRLGTDLSVTPVVKAEAGEPDPAFSLEIIPVKGGETIQVADYRTLADKITQYMEEPEKLEKMARTAYAAIKDLKVGEISEPVESQDNEGYLQGRTGNLVYKVIKIDKIVPAHTATFEHDYTQILDKVKEIKQKEAVDAFLAGKVKDTYIIIDPLFHECEFTREVWNARK